MARLLDQRLVTQYGKYKALQNLLEKWLDEKREELFLAIKRGAKCPEAGPFLLAIEIATDRLNWKDQFVAYLKASGKKAKQIDKIFAAIEVKPRATHERLASKRNANFKRKFPIRLPA